MSAMHTFVSLEIGSEQSGRRLGGWNGIIIQPFVQRISILVPRATSRPYFGPGGTMQWTFLIVLYVCLVAPILGDISAQMCLFSLLLIFPENVHVAIQLLMLHFTENQHHFTSDSGSGSGLINLQPKKSTERNLTKKCRH